MSNIQNYDLKYSFTKLCKYTNYKRGNKINQCDLAVSRDQACELDNDSHTY